MTKKYKVFALKKEKTLFQEVNEHGYLITIDAKDVDNIEDFCTFETKSSAKSLLTEHKDRLKGFKICELEVTKQFTIREI